MNKYIFLIVTILLITTCSEDDVINEAAEQLKTDQLEQKAKLQDAADRELSVVGLDENNNNFIIKLSDATEVVIPNSASFILIGEEGNWWIDGIDTEQSAKDGNGEERKVTISRNGVWQIDGKDTGIKLKDDKLKFETEIISITFKDKTMVFTFADRTTITLDATNLDIDRPGIPPEAITVNKMQWLRIIVEIDDDEETNFIWTLNEEVIGTKKDLLHVFADAGTYNIELEATNPMETSSKKIIVTVEDQTYTNNVTRVFEYFPAPGQLINEMPKATEEDDAESMRKKAEDALIDNSMISLGSFGGYVIMGFDHTIVNREGTDFVVLGSASLNAAKPGVIMVSYDANGNGLPDDEWFEIEGSQHSEEGTIKDYEITYYKPEEEPADPNELNYIRWTDNQDETGYIAKNNHHKQPYFPIWKDESITFTGTFLKSTMHDQSNDGSDWVNPAYEFGYANNWPNSDERAQIDIDWAIDKDGNKVKLKGVDFVKIYTANRAEDRTGEVSTEVSGFRDLNLQE